jgi:hypothetical protein
MIVAGSTLVFGTIAIWILMGYYSVRILRSFKGGVLSRGWKYICIAVPFLIFGQLATSMGSSGSVALIQDQIFRVAGASLSLLGGIMIVIGFRTEYRAWNPKQMRSQTLNEQKPISEQAIA